MSDLALGGPLNKSPVHNKDTTSLAVHPKNQFGGICIRLTRVFARFIGQPAHFTLFHFRMLLIVASILCKISRIKLQLFSCFIFIYSCICDTIFIVRMRFPDKLTAAL